MPRLNRSGKSLMWLLAAWIWSAASVALAAEPDAECAGPDGPVQLVVSVEGLRSSSGLVAVTVYADDSRRFLAKRGSLFVARVAAQAPITRVCVRMPAPGTYALAVYHDVNADRRFNRNGIGLPAEGFGFSNNPSTLFGIPAFRAVRLRVESSGTTTGVRLRYP